MRRNKLTPEAVAAAPGSGTCACDAVRRNPEYSSPLIRTEDFASEFLARRYRLPMAFARVVAELAGIGGRIG